MTDDRIFQMLLENGDAHVIAHSETNFICLRLRPVKLFGVRGYGRLKFL